MEAASIASTGIVLEVLTRENYLDWSALVKNYLIGKDLWDDIVEGNLDAQHSDWKSKNGQALHAIQLSCGHYTLGQIRNCVTAQEAWNRLKAAFSENLNADQDIEQGGLQTDIDKFHVALKKGMWNDAILFISQDGDIISQKSSSKGWTSLHVAVDAGQDKIMKELVEMGALLTEEDWEGYTPFALAVKSTDDIKIVEWMLNKGGNDLLTMKIKADDDKGDIPVLLAATKGHKKVTRFLFSKTRWFTLLDNNCYYGAKLLSHCIHAQIFDVALALIQHDGTQIPLSYESRECKRPIYGLAHTPTAFPSGTKLSWFGKIFYNVLWIPPYIDHEDKRIKIESQDGGSSTYTFFPGSIKRLHEIKRNHYLVRDILRGFCEKIEKISSESAELHQWSVDDAMLQAAKHGTLEFINSMREANPDLLYAMDKNKRGIFAHAILNRKASVFRLVYKIEGHEGLKTSIDIFGNNLLHLAAELGPSSYRDRRSNAALQMQRELQWFQMVESIVPPMCQEAKNADGLKPRELFKKNHEQLVNEGRQWAKDIASSFTIMGTLIITIMFAAAFTVPGGNNQDKGTPIFLGRNAFSFFIISDALSLTASSSSVLMFIGVLISRYTEEDFVTSLPIKLLFGLFTIFLSVVFMMCAFCAALALMLKGYRWIIKAAIVSSIIPILVFMFTLLRLFLEVCTSFVKSCFLGKKQKFIRRLCYL
ncbi:putative ankyrin repeat-containing domain, PGG domain-containing protein [Medicago truncatula]|uniref:Putative ankyrin repeat-containing domain, PGG domain-containing protein n=1 Tax=Medicago truncatula TaxID=3880 RepID=A0A396HAU5_MEDTR|nr:uncharacterized protein LOC112422453 [Medicago truncatula]RHN50409.1 putative ankyrin repeat-containing domain, PGG domain-containing protein [Medicago truncatula]